MPRCRTWSKFRGISMGLGIAPTRFTVPEFPAENDRAGRNFTPVSLDFLGRTCYNQRSFILFKMLMRTNRGPALHAAERAAPQGCCKQPAMCRTSTTAECRGEPLSGAPVTAQRVACSSTQFGWNRGTQLDLSKALHPVKQMRGEASFLLYQTHFSCQEGVTP